MALEGDFLLAMHPWNVDVKSHLRNVVAAEVNMRIRTGLLIVADYQIIEGSLGICL